MKDIKRTLIKWLRSIGLEEAQAYSVLDGIILKMLPTCEKLRMQPLKVLEKASNQTNCTSIDMLKKNINFVFSKEIKKRQRAKEQVNYIEQRESGTPVSKETLERFRTRIIN